MNDVAAGRRGRGVVLLSVTASAVLLTVGFFRDRQREAQVRELQQQLAAATKVFATREDQTTMAASLRQAMLEALQRDETARLVNRTAAPHVTPNDSDATPVTVPTAQSKTIEPSQIRDHYESSFLEDAVDSVWDARARASVVERLSAVLPEGSIIRSVDCRESLCRIETSHLDLPRYKAFLQKAYIDRATQLWNGPMFSTPLKDVPDDGTIVIVSFLAREGKQLPAFPQE